MCQFRKNLLITLIGSMALLCSCSDKGSEVISTSESSSSDPSISSGPVLSSGQSEAAPSSQGAGPSSSSPLSSPLFSSSAIPGSSMGSSIGPWVSSSSLFLISSMGNASSSSGALVLVSSSQGISSSGPAIGTRLGSMIFTAANLWVDTTETTQAAYAATMGESPSFYNRTGCPSCPVENLTPYEAMLFANARTKAELGSLDTVYQYASVTYGTPGTTSAQTKSTEAQALVGLAIRSGAKGFRLPTESEWELLQRGGNSSTDPYWVPLYPNDYAAATSHADLYAWFKDNASGTPKVVAQKIPNGYGLYDILGNVEEYTSTPKASGYVSKGTAANATLGALMMVMGVQSQWLTGVRLVRDP